MVLSAPMAGIDRAKRAVFLDNGLHKFRSALALESLGLLAIPVRLCDDHVARDLA